MSAPRVMAERISGYIGQNVRVVGKVVSADGKEATLELAPGMMVKVVGVVDGSKYTSGHIEIVGSVKDATTLEELKCIPFDPDFG
mmetsp:Transcript_4202/g.8084  ORF Transcript_4202/g.8084 Transcript_4202/m.8084 type:complete len:85 (-) Transcript_4202:55-309(-)